MNSKNQEALKLASETEISIKIDRLLQRFPFLKVTNLSRMVPKMGHFKNLIMVTLIRFTRYCLLVTSFGFCGILFFYDH
jgi:hypothetical protein